MGCRARCGLWRSVKNPKPLPVRSYINLHRLNLPLAALLYRHTPGLNKVCQATLHLASTLFTSVMMVQPLTLLMYSKQYTLISPMQPL